ncbi:hypothetical protein MMN89_27720, partial [Escherichia coli]|nr:hypothetical protein [Escherichia coli]
ICAPLKPFTFGKRVGSSCSGKQTTVGSGGFFVCKQQITRRKKGSQEDPCMSYLPLTIKQAIKFMNEHIPILLSKNKK